ncbi:MAG TPA: diacylglycerol kinase family protein [Flavisolibacter sp.]|nr:diacylglycerol kinase family protein [Flavisolibacter sp.]
MKKPAKRFSWKDRGASFRYAYHGLVALFRTEHNAWIHSGFTIAALLLSAILTISRTEALLLLIAMTLVWITEIINTAIEKTMDFISNERHPQIKLVKDLAAAAVLLSAVAALLIGALIFLPKLLNYV